MYYYLHNYTLRHIIVIMQVSIKYKQIVLMTVETSLKILLQQNREKLNFNLKSYTSTM